MAIKGLKSTQLANDPTTSALKFNFKTYEQKNSPFYNNSTNIDFVTYNGSLYVCVENGVSFKAGDPANNGFLLLVRKGEDGRQGIDGKEGPMGPMPNYTLSFDGKQMVVVEQSTGIRKAVSPDLTGPVWVPELHDKKIVWTREEYSANTRPADIDLEQLRPTEERPLLLRTNSDNTKRSDESSGPANMIQWKHEGDEYWTNLISISELMNLTLAGVSFWQDEEDDNSWHFGHKEVLKATYSSSKDSTKIVAVELGDVLYDAGKVPFPDNTIDLEAIRIRLDDLEREVQLLNLRIPTRVGQLENDVPYLKEVDLANYAKKSEIPDAVDAYTKEQSDARYQPKGNYLTEHQSLKTINNESLIGTGNITISAGSISLFDIKIENGHLYKTSNGQDWVDLGAIGGSGSDSGCPECWTREQIQDLINTSLEGLNLPSEWVTFADLDRFITISDLVDYATKSYVESRIQDAMTDQTDLDYYRIFTLYQRTNSRTIAPAAPVQGNFVWDTSKGEIVLQPTFTSNWENHPQNATTAAPYLWQATATYSYKSKSETKGDDETEYWHIICLTGEPGKDGSDGNGVEFIYTLVDSLAEFNTLTTPIAPGAGPDSYPDPWQDHPEGVSEEHQIEAASVRKYNGVTEQWEAYCEPFIWSKWGEDGVDGDGVEYIFHVDASDTLSNNLIPAQTLEEIYYTTNGQIDYSRPKPGYENYDSSDWVPDGNSGRPDQNWTDNPSDISEQKPYEWVSIRKYDGQTGHWGPFSNPKIWGLWGQKTVIQQEVVSGTTVYKPYNCYAFTRTNVDISGYRVTGGQAYDDPLDGIVTKNGNTVVQMTWFDGIPNGTEQLWSIQALIGDESQSSDAAWSSPARVGDRPGFQVEFAPSNNNTDAVYNKTKTLPSLNNYIADTPEGVDEVAWSTAASNANCGSWTDESDENTVYMAESRIVAGSWTAWNVIKIKGEKGEPGEGLPGSDGNSIEFVYYRTKGAEPGIEVVDELERGTYDPEDASVRNKTDKDSERDKFFPAVSIGTKTDGDYWHDHPTGVDEIYTHEWVAMRTSAIQDGKRYWSSNFSVSLWSKFGANGRDGDGVEYVFWGLSKQDVQQITSTWPTQQASNNINNGANVDDPNDRRQDKNGKFITDNEYLPAILINNVGREAVDNNPGIENSEYVYASMRRYNGSSHTWGEFSEIKLWNEQSTDNYNCVLHIENDSESILVDNLNVVDDSFKTFDVNIDDLWLRHNTTLLNIDKIAVNGVEFVNFSGQSITPVTGASATIELDTTHNLNITYAGAYVSSDRYNIKSIRLRLTFSDNSEIVAPITIPISAYSNEFVGTDVLTIFPVNTDKLIKLSTAVTSDFHTSTRASYDYDQLTVGINPSLYREPIKAIEKLNYWVAFDQDKETAFTSGTSFFGPFSVPNAERPGAPGINGTLEYDYYFKNDGTLQNSVNDETLIHIHIYHTGNEMRDTNQWSGYAQVYFGDHFANPNNGFLPIDNIIVGVGYPNSSNVPVVTDREEFKIIYNGDAGPQGDKGDVVERMYFLTNALEPYNNAFSLLRTDYDAYIGDYLWPCLANTPSISTTINENTVYYLNISGDRYAVTAMSKNVPSVDSIYKYRWVIERNVTYNGNSPIYGSWSIPVLDGNYAIDGVTGKTVRVSVWESGKSYYDGTVAVDGIYYLDIVTTTAISTNGGNGVTYYVCTTSHTSSSTFAADQNTKWQVLDSTTPVITPFILADKIQASQINVEDLFVNGDIDVDVITDRSGVNYGEHLVINPNEFELSETNKDNNLSAGINISPDATSMGDRTDGTVEIWQDQVGPALAVSGVLKHRSGLFAKSITNVSANSQSYNIDSELVIVTHTNGGTSSGLYSTAILPSFGNTSNLNGAHITFLRTNTGVCKIQAASGQIVYVNGTNAGPVNSFDFTSSRVDIIYLENSIYAWQQ